MHPKNGTIPTDVDKKLLMKDLIHERNTILVDIMIKMDKKIIGICYGMQFLNSYFGGKIYVDIKKSIKY